MHGHEDDPFLQRCNTTQCKNMEIPEIVSISYSEQSKHARNFLKENSIMKVKCKDMKMTTSWIFVASLAPVIYSSFVAPIVPRHSLNGAERGATKLPPFDKARRTGT